MGCVCLSHFALMIDVLHYKKGPVHKYSINLRVLLDSQATTFLGVWMQKHCNLLQTRQLGH